ncbi:serine hydrolase domain-containing protein [Diaminobutyricimonas aerilata]|nr:serine hydrolase domain-containing protein [Diaminobutyricimonas aerilata]
MDTRTKKVSLAVGASAIAIGLTATLAGAFGAFGSPPPASSTAVQRSLEGLVDDGFPGALATVTDGRGDTTEYVAGASERGTDEPVPADGYVRMGSNTKTYVAVVVLQLVEEGLVDLDESIETYLPGLLVGDGIDASRITVRNLLQHTSGLPSYTTALATDLLAIRDRYLSARDLIDLALTMPADFAPGERWSYSNTNYTVAGLLIEKLTGRPLREQIADRILEPLDLEHTVYPAEGERTLPEPHPRGYHRDADGELVDITETDPGWAGAAGAIVATPSDLNTFTRALLDGELLDAAMLDEMRTTVPADDLWAGARYGLGLMSYPLSCGGVAWGHGGDISGFETRNGATEDGRAVTVAVTALPSAVSPEEESAIALAQQVNAAVDTALCD